MIRRNIEKMQKEQRPLASNTSARRETMLRTFAAIGLILCTASSVNGLGMESFGNEELSDVNYSDWPMAIRLINSKHRIYHQWVNGNESFYFQGKTTELNTALLKFAAIEANRLTVVLHPGPGKSHSFNKEREFTFSWHLHLLGGISTHMSTLHFGKEIWDPNPYLHIYVGNGIVLEDIRIPKEVEVLEIADLQVRYSKCLGSNDRTVRGWSCGHIARLDPYNVESMRKIVAMIGDSDDWVKLNAVGALSNFPEFSREVIRKLESMKTDDERLLKRIKQTVRQLHEAQQDPRARNDFRQLQVSIHSYTESLRNN